MRSTSEGYSEVPKQTSNFTQMPAIILGLFHMGVREVRWTLLLMRSIRLIIVIAKLATDTIHESLTKPHLRMGINNFRSLWNFATFWLVMQVYDLGFCGISQGISKWMSSRKWSNRKTADSELCKLDFRRAFQQVIVVFRIRRWLLSTLKVLWLSFLGFR
jgi:hypothetical protein